MTSEAPERIWVYAPDNPEKIVGCDPMGYAADVDGDEYFLRSYALALVAEAYEGAAEFARDTADQEQADDGVVLADLAQVMDAIESRTPADALAAREARDKKVREEALREAAAIVRMSREFEFDGAGNAVGYTNPSPDEAAEAIIALIEGDADG